jgi:hypothetical protein
MSMVQLALRRPYTFIVMATTCLRDGALLAAQRQATQLSGQARLSQVFLVKALGGDW